MAAFSLVSLAAVVWACHATLPPPPTGLVALRDQPKETTCTFSCGTVSYALQGGSNF